jgi:hypothetical protein
MIIKKLSKEQLDEGISVEIVNALNMEKNYSPIQLQKGDEPVNIMPCTGGFWVMYEPGKFLKDEKNKYIIFPEKECRIGRARYLLNYGKEEKRLKIEALVVQWTKEVRVAIDRVKKNVESLKQDPNNFSLGRSIMSALKGEEAANKWEEENGEKYSQLYPKYLELEKLYEQGDICSLLDFFGTKKFNNPMLSAHLDDDEAMRVVKNTFGANAIDEWIGSGAGIINRYAAIEIEKEYSF